MNNINLFHKLNNLIDKYTIKDIANKLNVASGTINRWIELKNIPKNYTIDILKLLDEHIDYSVFSSKEKDQFYTPIETAELCYNIFINEINKLNIDINSYIFIEPSAGDYSFVKILTKNNINCISMDIEPKNDLIIQQDYLKWFPEDTNKKYIVFGNPPFGLRGHMALKFINHSYEFADFVCFILPQLFESDGKGTPRKRINKGYNLIYSNKLDSLFYEPNGNNIKINTIFQIWSKNYKNNEYNYKIYNNENIKIYSLSDGGTPNSTRNKDMIDKCDFYIPSTCFGKENMKLYSSFNELPGKKGYGIVFKNNKEEYSNILKNVNLSDIAFLSTNSAYNLRTSQIYSLF